MDRPAPIPWIDDEGNVFEALKYTCVAFRLLNDDRDDADILDMMRTIKAIQADVLELDRANLLTLQHATDEIVRSCPTERSMHRELARLKLETYKT